jgi:hypothetical protein
VAHKNTVVRIQLRTIQNPTMKTLAKIAKDISVSLDVLIHPVK